MNNADFFVEPVRETPIINDVDVLVCGGGFAGVAAAVAAARNGASVMLVERYGFLGGLATGALVITTPPLNNGINREIARRLMAWQSYAPNSDKENATASGTSARATVKPDRISVLIRVGVKEITGEFRQSPIGNRSANAARVSRVTRDTTSKSG